MRSSALLRPRPRLGLVLLLLAGPAVAQGVSGEEAVTAATAQGSRLPPDSFAGELGFGKLADDYFLTLALRLSFDREGWGVGLQLPVRFRLIDQDPQNEEDIGGIIRREDWDEPSDFLRFIRYVYVGQADKRGPYYVRLGALDGLTVGHGTIMYRYFNSLDLDRWHTGVNAAVNVGPWGGEAVIGDVVSPYLFGVRASVRPLMLAAGEGFLAEKLVTGITLMADARAPYALETRLQTDPMDSTRTSTVVSLDEHNLPVVAERKALVIVGLDVGLEVLSTELLSITPYIDVNKMTVVSGGWGLHLGVLWQFRFPLAIDTLTADLRTEYRRVSGDYLGPYFDASYEIERYQRLSSGGVALPKLRDLDQHASAGRNGVFFDVSAGLPSLAFVGGEYVDYDGGQADGTLRLSLEVPALEAVRFSAFYYRINIRGASDLFALDDRSALVAQASIPLYAFLSLNLRWWRVWRADPANAGQFSASDDYSASVGFNFVL